MLRVYHISYMYIPVVGFITTIIVGFCLSLLIKRFCSKNKFISGIKLKLNQCIIILLLMNYISIAKEAIDKSDVSLLSPIVGYLCPTCVKTDEVSDKKGFNFTANSLKVFISF